MMRAIDIAEAVRSGRTTASATAERCLAGLAEAGPLVAVTRTLAERACAEAQAVDAAVAAGRDPGPLAGVPYGVKDLFDVAGLPTTAGSALYADAPPAAADAEAVARLRAAGAVLVATLNMDEFAYGFATINARHGTTRNPHDYDRLAGGSSGGSAAVVAAGLLPFALGSDTNGSVRVPASLTGVYGLKPTHADLPLAGVFPFAASFDDVGHFARSAADMARIWAVLRGRAPEPERGEVRVARLGGRFAENVDPHQFAAISAIAPDAPVVTLPNIARARSAAFLITACEGGALHRAALAKHAMAFDPATRDRLIAGALLPHGLYDEAQAFRAAFREQVTALMADVDILLAPGTPCTAPPVEDPRIRIDGAMVPARADLGIHTQPISFLGLPSLAVPLLRPGRLPLGLQLIGKAGSEATLFAYAARLEQQGMVGVSPPPGHFRGSMP
jgi:aspartyl-tRNA(Asn)/glutamyl-tRNA(Gln) amidotransferase subunit A